MSTAHYDSITAIIEARTGLVLSENQRAELERIAEQAQASLGIRGLRELAEALLSRPTEHPVWQDIIYEVTIGETYFFRNEDQFNALRNHVLPPLLEKRRQSGTKHLRLWSAGCATGEEPYSIAMLLREILPDYDTWQITLLATDLNETSLARAHRGIYRTWSFRNETPDYIRQRWFEATNDGFKLVDPIRHAVLFRPLNLVSEDYPSFESGTMNMDVIICRNVTIYFTEQTTRAVVSRFHRALTDEGWLIVGHSEPISAIYQGFIPRNFPNTVLYQKARISEMVEPAPVLPQKPVTPPLPRSAPRAVDKASVPAQTRSIDELYQLAKAAADQERWSEALKWLDQAEAVGKFHPQIYYLRAVIQWHTGRVSEAVASLRQAIFCNPGFALAQYTLGELYHEIGDAQSAVRHWRLAQVALMSQPPHERLAFADELTVEMLLGLLKHRLNMLPMRK